MRARPSVYLPYGLCLLLFLISGCGRSIPLEGTVTVDGEQIQNGMIVFTPDIDAENSGPRATAKIEDGRFTLLKKSRLTPGPNVVTVTDSDDNGRSYRIKMDIPEDGDSDFKIEIDSSE